MNTDSSMLASDLVLRRATAAGSFAASSRRPSQMHRADPLGQPTTNLAAEGIAPQEVILDRLEKYSMLVRRSSKWQL
jgi:hypothetical protein